MVRGSHRLLIGLIIAVGSLQGAYATGPSSGNSFDLAAFLEGGGEQPACGGPGQRACCFGERIGPSCNDGLREVALGQFPAACGVGAGTCVPISQATACGGEGQRTCCAGEGAAVCQPGLIPTPDDFAFDFFVPVTGDATCGNEPISGSSVPRSQGTCVRPTRPTIAEPATGWSPAQEPRGVMRGFLDMHLHLLGHMAHGGRNVVGEPAPIVNGQFVLDGSANINTALDPATDVAVHKIKFHGLFNDASGEGTGDGARSEFGAPYFSGWPKWTSTTHQQTYYVWLERAWRGGLRSTTMFASHVESLCKTSLKATREESWPICEDSMRWVVDQLRMAYDFQRFIDERSGGAGLGWFRIVTTPEQARTVVRAGKLAVVLGIEVDNLFNCKEGGCPADFGLPAERLVGLTSLPAPTTLEQAVDVIHSMGVRHVFPIHNFDNNFGAAATWMDPIAVGQAIAQQRWWIVRDCGDARGDYGFWLDNFMQDILQFLGFGVSEAPPVPAYINGNLEPEFASCNALGLKAGSGPALIRALMNKGMLIDVDHMAANSVDEVLAIAANGPRGDQASYPLVASHVQPFDLYQKEFVGNKGRHERMRTRAQLEAIRNGGGMVAAMLKTDTQDNNEDPLRYGKFSQQYVPQVGSTIVDNCRHSSRNWAQMVQYLVDVMGGPVAMGSDFNGAAGHIGPRFGSDACGGWGLPNGFERPQQEIDGTRIAYPFTLPGFGQFAAQQTGFKTFDYNVDGLAHVGLLPDLMADLDRIGVDPHYSDAVFCSAEAYIRVWERADALARGDAAPDPNRPWLCNVTDSTPPSSTMTASPAPNANGWNLSDVTLTFAATDDSSGVERINYTLTRDGHAASGTASGAAASAAVTGEGLTTIEHSAVDLAGNVEPPNTSAVRIDRTAPTITGTRSPAANAAGWNNTPVTVIFSCDDATSGVESCDKGRVLSSEGADQDVVGMASDLAGNFNKAAVGNIDIDLTPPVVSISGVTDGATYPFGAVPAAGCQTADALSGVASEAALAISGGTINSVGTFVVTCSGARDLAGNTASTSVSYVVRYVFNGFAAPIRNHPTVNAVRAGQTVPVKFSLSGDFGLDVLAGGSATSAIIGCASGDVDPLEVTVNNPGASVFSYDPASDQYQFNWKTDRAWAGSCRRLIVRLDDGSVHTADFRLQ